MNEKLYLIVSEVCVSDQPVPPKIVDKIVKYHINPLAVVTKETGIKIFCRNGKGLRSGFRSYRWEKLRGRDGTSEHCFGQEKNGKINTLKKGAIDIRCPHFSTTKWYLVEGLLDYTKYTRIIVYPFHIHADYFYEDGKRRVFSSTEDNPELKLRETFKL